MVSGCSRALEASFVCWKSSISSSEQEQLIEHLSLFVQDSIRMTERSILSRRLQNQMFLIAQAIVFVIFLEGTSALRSAALLNL